MKKLLLFTVCLMLLSGSYLFAQKGKEVILGVNGAVTNVWILNQNFYGEPEIEYAPKVGYAASFSLGYNFTENISVLTELQYSLQGQKYDGKQSFGGNKYDVERDINLRYFNIPLFFKYSFGDKTTKFRFLIGPQFDMLLEATQDYTRDGAKLNYGTEDLPIPTNLDGEEFIPDAGDITDRFESTDISLAVDVGADVHLSDQWYISAGVRGNYGFKDINAPAYRMKDFDGEYTPSHNAWGGLYVGIHFKIDVESYSQRSF